MQHTFLVIHSAERMHAVFFFQAEDGIRDHCVTGVQTCALPIFALHAAPASLELAAVAGGASVPRDLVVTNVGAAPGAFTATPSQPWLVVTGSLVAPSTLQVSALEIGRASCRERG